MKDDDNDHDSGCYEFGLAGAGAVSAGAYTAGVVDFLIEALDAWQAAKESGQDVPPHRVRWRVFTGSSAGGMTAALALGALGSRQPPVRTPADAAAHPRANKLYDCWVERIDISRLLQTADLADATSPVTSLLDATALEEIAAGGQDIVPAPRRAYLSDRFELLMTVTNLRGVPYAVDMQGFEQARHRMTLHADHVHVVVTDQPLPQPPDRYAMTWDDLGRPGHPVRDCIRQAALATGAYPLALAPRMLAHRLRGGAGAVDPYSARLWPRLSPEGGPWPRTLSYGTIPVDWGALPDRFDYRFAAVDGGLINNEPFELARRVLWDAPGERPEGQGQRAAKGLILVDPFPAPSQFDAAQQPQDLTVAKIAARLLKVLTNQARFKPDELAAAADDDTFSRFMVVPTRADEAHALASGALHGFSGFLKQAFREHDFFLGRRNAQKFLRDRFALPEGNPLFRGWTEAQREAWCVRDGHGRPERRDGGQRLLPIIPLVGALQAQACHKPDWPAFTTADMDALMPQVERRVDAVLRSTLHRAMAELFVLWRLLARLILWRVKRRWLGVLRRHVEQALREMQLMR